MFNFQQFRVCINNLNNIAIYILTVDLSVTVTVDNFMKGIVCNPSV
jgi:hypothetical protein